jgi:hypothetical protein
MGACPMCGGGVPPGAGRGAPKRFCSTACKSAWWRAARRVGAVVLADPASVTVYGLPAAEVPAWRALLPRAR